MTTNNKRLTIEQIIGEVGYYIDRYEWKEYLPFVFNKLEEYHKLMVVELPSKLAVGDPVEFSIHLENKPNLCKVIFYLHKNKSQTPFAERIE